MQKISQSLGEHLQPVTLYMDEIEQIVNAFREISPDVSVSTNDYLLTDFKQLSEFKKEYLTDVNIKVREPYIDLSLEHHQIFLYAAKDDLISRGLYEKVKAILRKNKRPFFKILQNFGIITGISLYLILYGLSRQSWQTVSVAAVSLLVSIAIGWYAYQDRFKKFSIIIPKYKVEVPSFWKRNSDALVLALFSAVFGGIVTLILVKAFNITPP